jgi:hypothetical protein
LSAEVLPVYVSRVLWSDYDWFCTACRVCVNVTVTKIHLYI